MSGGDFADMHQMNNLIDVVADAAQFMAGHEVGRGAFIDLHGSVERGGAGEVS